MAKPERCLTCVWPSLRSGVKVPRRPIRYALLAIAFLTSSIGAFGMKEAAASHGVERAYDAFFENRVNSQAFMYYESMANGLTRIGPP